MNDDILEKAVELFSVICIAAATVLFTSGMLYLTIHIWGLI